ncbi:conjugal transfer protein TraP [Salmonella enterica subsp. enterica serovar 4,[5],12:b:-]|nr:conjugal transfer protein TraP [Salmonella enterica subsp. enterica serovar 4,[5],12:b:-]
MKSETEADETGSFGETVAPPLPVWKRSVWGVPVTMWGVCALLLLAAAWYLFLRTPQDTTMPAFNDMGTDTQTWQTPTGADLTQSPGNTTVRTGEDMSQFARDVKTELDNRDEKIQTTLNMLQDSIQKLSVAIKKDEEYAQETRRQLNELQLRLTSIMAQHSVSGLKSASPETKKKTVSALSGMKIMSLETGMAWIRWKGSTWAVREGDSLGSVAIQRIDPVTRTITTSAGTLR